MRSIRARLLALPLILPIATQAFAQTPVKDPEPFVWDKAGASTSATSTSR